MPIDETYPTVSTESVLIMATIHAHGERDVGIWDISGAFLSAEMYMDVKIMLCERLAEIIENIAPKIYRQNVIYDKKRSGPIHPIP